LNSKSRILVNNRVVPSSEVSQPKTQSSVQPTAVHTSQQPRANPVASKPLPQTSTERYAEEDKPTHHYGRDAAIGAGTGAAGIGGYEALKHREHDTQPQSSVDVHNTASFEPTNVDQANLQTPATSTVTARPTADATSQPASSQKYVSLLDPLSEGTPASASSANEDHHYGRDAALGAGVGAVGTGGYEALKDRIHGVNSSSHLQPSEKVTTDPNSSSQPIGGLRNLVDEKTGSEANDPADSWPLKTNDAQPTATQSTTQPLGSVRDLVNEKTGSESTAPGSIPAKAGSDQSDNHSYGRDAAIGAGAAGIGYEAARHGNQPTSSQPTEKTITNPDSSSKPLGSLRDLINEKLGQSTVETAPNQSSQSTSAKPESESHNYGRDAALATGTGIAGTKSFEASRNRDLPAQSGSIGSTFSGPESNKAAQQSTAHPVTQYSSPVQENKLDTTSSLPPTARQDDSHHYGRDATLGAGVGAVGIGGYETFKRDTPSQSTGATTSSTFDSQRATAPSSTQPSTVTPSTQYKSPAQHDKLDTASSLPSSAQPKEHYYGRDAALGAGAGAAGLAGYEALKSRGPGDQPVGSSSTGSGIPPSTAYQPTIGGDQNTSTSGIPTRSAAEQNKLSEHHYGRDAVVGTGVGAAGVGGYEALKHGDNSTVSATPTQPISQTTPAAVQPTSQGFDPSKTAFQEPKSDDHHYGRDAAIGAGATGAGAAAYEAKKHEDEKKALEKEQKEHEKQLAEEQKKAEKEHEKELKHQEKEAKKAEKEHQKAIAAEEKAHEKEIRKAEKEHEKELKKEEKQHAKEVEAAEKEEKKRKEKEAAAAAGIGATGLAAAEHEHNKDKDDEFKDDSSDKHEKKKGGILGIFHRHKKDDAHEDKDKHHEKEALAGAGAVGAGALGKHEYDEHRDGVSTGSNVTGGTAGIPQNQQAQPHDGHRRGEEAALGAGAIGTAAVGKHEYDRHSGPGIASTSEQPQATDRIYRDSLGHLHREQVESTEPPIVPAATGDKVYTDSLGHLQREKVDPTQETTTGQSHHGKEAALGAGAVGAAALGKHEYNQHHEAGTTHPSNLGDTHGYYNEHYVHHKTEKDLAAERRNSIPIIGELHREGRFHGKEGGAPGAVGVAPDERDQAYIESQKHLPLQHHIGHHHQEGQHATQDEGEHKKHHGGILGIFHKDKHDERNRLHKASFSSSVFYFFRLTFIGSSCGTSCR
jgi:hypothetical protein